MNSSRQRPSDFEGSLRPFCLFDIYRQIYLAKRTGTLQISSRETSRKIAFRNGTIVLVATNQNRERLGSLLISSGIITPAQMEGARRVKGVRLGQALVHQGAVEQHQLDRYVRLHQTQLAVSALEWHHGTYSFVHRLLAQCADVFVDLCTADIIIEAVRALRDSTAIRYLLGDPNRKLRPAADVAERLRGISLSSSEGYLLSRFESAASISEIRQVSALDEEQTAKGILALILAGILVREGQLPGPSSSSMIPDLARKAFDEGRELYRAGDFAAASNKLREAVHLQGTETQYRFLLAQTLARITGGKREAEFHFLAVIQQAPGNVDYRRAFEQFRRPSSAESQLEMLFKKAVTDLDGNKRLVVATAEERRKLLESPFQRSKFQKTFP